MTPAPCSQLLMNGHRASTFQAVQPPVSEQPIRQTLPMPPARLAERWGFIASATAATLQQQQQAAPVCSALLVARDVTTLTEAAPSRLEGAPFMMACRMQRHKCCITWCDAVLSLVVVLVSWLRHQSLQQQDAATGCQHLLAVLNDGHSILIREG